MEMQGLDEESQRLNSEVARVKENMKRGTNELERLRAKRAKLEKLKANKEDESEDLRFVGLYDW
jgi:prefoldin subunit 5